MIVWLSQFDFSGPLLKEFPNENFSFTSNNFDYLLSDVYKGKFIELPMNSLTNLDTYADSIAAIPNGELVTMGLQNYKTTLTVGTNIYLNNQFNTNPTKYNDDNTN